MFLLVITIPAFLFSAGQKEGAGNTFNMMIKGEPTTLDPQQFRDDDATSIIYAVHEPLIRIGGTGGRGTEYGLAEKIETNKDYTVYTVYLRESNVWADGTPITAEDVVNTFRRVVDPALGSKKVNDYFLLKNAESIYNSRTESSDAEPIQDIPFEELGVKAKGTFIVEFTLENPVEFFLDYLKTPGWAPVQKRSSGQIWRTLWHRS